MNRTVTLHEGEHLSLTLLALPSSCAFTADGVEGVEVVGGEYGLEVNLDGRGASLDIRGLYLCAGEDDVKVNITVRHNVPGCVSRQLLKGVADGRSKFAFNGLIYVREGAFGTSAMQENHSLLMSGEAVVQTRPQLEIYADDVECSHGATIGYLNAEEQFYMRSRGIPEAEARKLQIVSFLSPVMSGLDGQLREKILGLL